MRLTDQHFPALVGRRCFISLASVYLGTLLTVSGPSALAVTVRERKLSSYDEQRLLEQNKRIQNANGAPPNFPNFIREGFNVKVMTPDNYVRCDSGLIYWDIKEGEGDYPKSGQQYFTTQGLTSQVVALIAVISKGGQPRHVWALMVWFQALKKGFRL